jgi:hypothetical protein
MIPGKDAEPLLLLIGANANEQEPGGVLRHGLFLDQSPRLATAPSSASASWRSSQAVVLVQRSSARFGFWRMVLGWSPSVALAGRGGGGGGGGGRIRKMTGGKF